MHPSRFYLLLSFYFDQLVLLKGYLAQILKISSRDDNGKGLWKCLFSIILLCNIGVNEIIVLGDAYRYVCDDILRLLPRVGQVTKVGQIICALFDCRATNLSANEEQPII